MTLAAFVTICWAGPVAAQDLPPAPPEPPERRGGSRGPDAFVAVAPMPSAGDPTLMPAPALPDVPEGFDEILLDLRIGRVIGRTVRALMEGERALLPARALLTMGEVEFELDPDGTLRALLHPGRRLVVIGSGGRAASIGGIPVAVPERAVVHQAGELYIEAPLLETLFGLVIRTDWSTLVSVVMDAEALPVGRRLAREARWRVLGGGEAGGAAAPVELDQRRLGGAVLDWSLSSSVDQPGASTSYAVGMGARAFGGSLQLSSRSLGPVALGQHRVEATYQAVWTDRRWLTQMSLGDAFVSGPRIRSMRGVALTNAPFLRQSLFSAGSFAGRSRPGWDVELRQSGRTVDLTRADESGAFALDIPLRYGENPLQIVAFGPHGEIVTTDRLVLLGADRLPARAFEWGLAGGACTDSRCSATGNLDLRYGLSDRWTARVGLEAFHRADADGLVQAYAGVTGGVTSALHLSAEALGSGFLRGGLVFAPSAALRLRAAHTRFSTALDRPVLHDPRRRSTTEADALVRPATSVPGWLVRGSVVHQDLVTGSLALWQLSSMLQLGPLGVEGGLRREADRPDLGAARARTYQTAALTTHLPVGARRKLWVRAEAEVLGGRSLDRLQARAAYQVSPSARLEVGRSWKRSAGGDFTISLSARMSGVRSITQLFAPETAEARLTQVAHGSVHWNEALGDVRFGTGPGVDRGGLAGYVFIDENGSGTRDPGERGVGDVRVIVGGRTLRSDEQGRLDAWDLVPFESVRVWTDSSSIPDPTLVPVRGAMRVAVPPASSGRLDVALTRSREIAGRVVRETADGALVPLPHVELELVDLDTGARRLVRAFSDGGFYEIGVKPGRYELGVSPGSLTGAGLAREPESVRLEVGIGPDAADLDDLLIRLGPDGPGPR